MVFNVKSRYIALRLVALCDAIGDIPFTIAGITDPYGYLSSYGKPPGVKEGQIVKVRFYRNIGMVIARFGTVTLRVSSSVSIVKLKNWEMIGRQIFVGDRWHDFIQLSEDEIIREMATVIKKGVDMRRYKNIALDNMKMAKII